MKLEGKLREYWIGYINAAVETLGLRDWEIALSDELIEEEPDETNVIPMATCNFTDGRKFARLELALEFIGRSPEEQRYYIAHELVHCHFGAAWRQVQKDLSTLLGRPADTVFWASFERNMEYGIDGVAHPLATVLPLPNQPTGGK
jgi:hypothetical protein